VQVHHVHERCLMRMGRTPAVVTGEEDVDKAAPTLIRSLASVSITAVGAGESHVLFCAADGSLFSCGCHFHGALGHGVEERCWTPKRVEALSSEFVVGAAGGQAHSVVCTLSKRVFAFGSNGRGQCGQPPVSQVLSPALVEGPWTEIVQANMRGTAPACCQPLAFACAV
jgi:alpha-tubulin suppressor-like RCC1 family protein